MKQRGLLFLLTLLAGSSLAIGTGGCGGATSSSSGGDDGSGETATNALSVAYPDDLAIASLTASSGSASALKAALAVGGVKNAEVTSEPPLEKKEDIENLLNFTDEATFTSELTEMKDEINIFATAPNANCYGPVVNYTDHPNASGGEPNDGQLPPGDLGIWEETEETTGEACVAAKLNNIIGQFEALINAGTKTVAATLGAASLDEALGDLPAAGESSDLTIQVNDVMSESDVPLSFDSATLTREAEETADGFPVLVTETTGTLTTEEGEATFETTLEHIPEVDLDSGTAALKSQEAVPEDETYCGRLTQQFSIPAGDLPTLGNCGGADGITRCTLVEYCKDSATSLTYHLRTAEFCGQNVDCGTVDPSDKVGGSNTDGWGNNFYYTVCNVNPEDGSGSCAQAWQAGAQDGNTRVLNVTVDAEGSGCGYFGYGPDVAAASGVGSIDRMICNWAGPGNNHTGVPKAQRQCFTRDASGKFVSDSDTLAITYAPTNSCDKLASNATFTYSLRDDPANGVAAGVAVTNNLINLADVDFTVPALPVVP
jgi:hypothetical protein